MHEMHSTTKLTIENLIAWGKASSTLPVSVRSRRVCGIHTDSRKVTRGDIFVALATERDDGHAYVQSALKSGACAAIVAKRRVSSLPASVHKRLIIVADPLTALQRMAAEYRHEMGLLVIGITGSSGKTTTRSFVTEVLASRVCTGSTAGNLNNHIGVPLSLLSLRGDEFVAVIEMGANHAGEIHTLSMIARPDIAVVANIGYAHIGNFGSLAGTTAAKMEIVDGMDNRTGLVLINGDDARLVKAASAARMRTELFGLSSRCTVRAVNVELTGDLHRRFEVDGMRYEVPMAGMHFVYAALPAIALGRRCGVAPDRIAQALAGMEPVDMRGTIETHRKIRFIVDCYNANPSSMQSGVAFLRELAGNSPRAAIVGDMLELGSYSRRLHRDLGRRLAQSGVETVIAVGDFAPEIAAGARAAGMSARSLHTTPTSAEAARLAPSILRAGQTVLVKGSRGVHLETVLKAFRK